VIDLEQHRCESTKRQVVSHARSMVGGCSSFSLVKCLVQTSQTRRALFGYNRQSASRGSADQAGGLKGGTVRTGLSCLVHEPGPIAVG
jgi:hypothetical protein